MVDVSRLCMHCCSFYNQDILTERMLEGSLSLFFFSFFLTIQQATTKFSSDMFGKTNKKLEVSRILGFSKRDVFSLAPPSI